MTWHMSAGGHTPAPEGERNWEAVERELHGRLTAILSDPKYGTGVSNFAGNFVSGPMHGLEPSAPGDEAGAVPEPALD